MKVITVGNAKGGVGKTTIACNLAVTAADKGNRVLLMDADTLGNSVSFRNLRKELQDKNDFQAVSAYKSQTLYEDVKAFNASHDYVIIDAGGGDSKAFRNAVAASHGGLMIIPIKLGQLDVWASNDTLEVIERVREIGGKIKAMFLVNQQLTSKTTITPEGMAAIEALSEQYNIGIMKTVLHARVDYVKSIAKGQSTCEFNKYSAAAKETRALYKEVISLLEE